MDDGRIAAVTHPATRFAVDVGEAFEDFRGRYEEAVPAYPAEEFEKLVERGAPWREVLALTERRAPHGFMIYWRYDAQPMMRLAGDRFRCVEYLMGNHTIAQRMFRRDPAIMLYAPLRTAVSEGPDGVTRFSFDQPSTRFGGFGDPEITSVGVELDRKLAALLRHLSVPVPQPLS
ncbi:DUF302 domain-containing protein [Sphaerisporangium sp. TRM90804]|uniref:DUF302 domain-containing protein n=1 Tax=Sphaerisporangium sp. TRM90804 TaxID=3031113 RepID=UPI00244AB558|nr:DUF302 domain-containing protein [Sphaerisporangium sp. TRM90804]MDH2430506.1 DUF302 domain-containing protein [Sphaerisporangium sp. TRM90804]